MSDQKTMDKYMTLSDARDELGYKSSTSIDQQVGKGNIRTVLMFKGTSNETRGFLKSDVAKLKRLREK